MYVCVLVCLCVCASVCVHACVCACLYTCALVTKPSPCRLDLMSRATTEHLLPSFRGLSLCILKVRANLYEFHGVSSCDSFSGKSG